MPNGVEIGAKLKFDTNEATKSVGNVKKELKEAQKNLFAMQTTFGDFSAEAVTAAKKVAELKDRIGDAKNFAESFNPDRKFAAFAGSVQGVTGGFTALTGVMGLLGAESGDVEKLLLKVQSALAITQGLDSIRESIDQFKNLGNQVKNVTLFKKADAAATKVAATVQKAFGIEVNATSTSFKVLKGAIVATGIGLLVIALGEAVSWLSELGDKSEEAAEKQKKLQETTIELAKAAHEGASYYIDREASLEEARAKARGATEKEIFEIQQRWQKQRVKSAIEHYNEVKGIDVENFKAREDAEKEALKGEVDRLNFIAKQKEEADRKEKERQTKAREKAKELARQKLEDEKAALKLLEELRAQAAEANARTEKDADLLKLKADFEEKKKILIKGHQELNALEDWYAAQKGKIIRKYDDEDRKIFLAAMEEADKRHQEEAQKRDDNIKAEIAAHREAALAVADDQTQSLDARRLALDIAEKAMIDNVKMSEDERTAMEANFVAARIDLAKQEADAKKGFYNDIGSALGAFSEILGKETAAGKALAIAQATINTWLGVTEVLKAKTILPEPMGTISKFVNIAAVVASGISAIKNIVKVQVKGGGAGGSVPGNLAPVTPQVNNNVTTLDRNSVNAIGNQAVRAFVVETDIANNQQRVSRINRAARIG
jgi:hypothetical protein